MTKIWINKDTELYPITLIYEAIDWKRDTTSWEYEIPDELWKAYSDCELQEVKLRKKILQYIEDNPSCINPDLVTYREE